ncbi:hypothetical protein AB5J62_40805 [Amycolatopsis sp. cg5]|uniref:hypothetical protein n=1 Tax=Amycolatopsis sp. cg5 TaxID=3238802 RepID=UPI00352653A6
MAEYIGGFVVVTGLAVVLVSGKLVRMAVVMPIAPFVGFLTGLPLHVLFGPLLFDPGLYRGHRPVLTPISEELRSPSGAAPVREEPPEHHQDGQRRKR